MNFESCLPPTPITPTFVLRNPPKCPPPCRFVCPNVLAGIFIPHLGTCTGWLFSRIMTVIPRDRGMNLTSLLLGHAHLAPGSPNAPQKHAAYSECLGEGEESTRAPVSTRCTRRHHKWSLHNEPGRAKVTQQAPLT